MRCFICTLPCAKLLQSCLDLCDPKGSFVHGILYARIRSGLPFPPAGDLLTQGLELASSALQADSSLLSRRGSPFICIKIVPEGITDAETHCTVGPPKTTCQ